MGGGDKGLMCWRGRPLVSYALAALEGVAETRLINANRSLGEYAAFGFPVIADANENFDGPLAGLLSRAVIVVDGDGKVRYTEQVPEIAQEPDYARALAAVKSLS